MYGAHQDGVGLVGGAAVGPVTQVVGAGPAGGTCAARPAAGAVAGHQGPAQGRRDQAPGAAQGEGIAALVDHDGGEAGVAGQAAGGLGVDGGAPVQVGGGAAGLVLEGGQVGDQAEVRALAAAGAQVALVELAAAQLDQVVGAALGGGALVVGAGRTGDGQEGGAEDGAALGIESSVEIEDALEGLAEVEVAAAVLALVLDQGTVGVETVAEVAGDPAQVLGVEAAGGLEQLGLGLLDGGGADLLGAVGDDRGVLTADLALAEGLLGGWEQGQAAGQADLLGGGARGEAAGGAEEGGGAGGVEGGEGAGAV